MSNSTTVSYRIFIFNGEVVSPKVFFRRIDWYSQKRSIRKKEIILMPQKYVRVVKTENGREVKALSYEVDTCVEVL